MKKEYINTNKLRLQLEVGFINSKIKYYNQENYDIDTLQKSITDLTIFLEVYKDKNKNEYCEFSFIFQDGKQYIYNGEYNLTKECIDNLDCDETLDIGDSPGGERRD